MILLIGYWGGFIFEVSSSRVYTFDGFGRKSSILVDEQELDGKKPSTYIKGEALEEISITVKLKSDLGIDVKSEIDKFKTALYNKNPQTFIIGNQPLSQNKWLLLSVNESETILDNGGNYISAILALSFKEYVRGGSKKAEKTGGTSSGSSGGTSGGIDESGYESGAVWKPKVITSRYNANVVLDAFGKPVNPRTPMIDTIAFKDTMEYRLYGGSGG